MKDISGADYSMTMRRARRDPAISNAAFRVLHAIFDECDPRGEVQGSLTAFAAISGLSAQATSGCFDRLASQGYVKVTRRGAGYPVAIKLLVRPPALTKSSMPAVEKLKRDAKTVKA
jgi:hypothetical protein